MRSKTHKKNVRLIATAIGGVEIVAWTFSLGTFLLVTFGTHNREIFT